MTKTNNEEDGGKKIKNLFNSKKYNEYVYLNSTLCVFVLQVMHHFYYMESEIEDDGT
jgi:hypothetical protein